MAPPEAPNLPTRPEAPTPKRRPDARPTRVILGLGTFAAMGVVTAGLVHPPATSADAANLDAASSSAIREEVTRCVRYVQLRPGEVAPVGATVIDGADQAERVVARAAGTGSRVTPAPRRRTVARSRQSGE